MFVYECCMWCVVCICEVHVVCVCVYVECVVCMCIYVVYVVCGVCGICGVHVHTCGVCRYICAHFLLPLLLFIVSKHALQLQHIYYAAMQNHIGQNPACCSILLTFLQHCGNFTVRGGARNFPMGG